MWFFINIFSIKNKPHDCSPARPGNLSWRAGDTDPERSEGEVEGSIWILHCVQNDVHAD